MQEILAVAADWVRRGRPFALATVTAVGGSAPREVGASMIVSDAGEVFGNVSGGCVESAVYVTAGEVLASGAVVIEQYGYSDADAFAVGLTCGGTIEVTVRPVLPDSAASRDVLLLAERDAHGMPTVVTIDRAGDNRGRLGILTDGDESGSVESPASDVARIAWGAPARLVIVGAVEFAVALSRLAQAMDRRVTVVDARDVFANPARFPGAEVVVDQPGHYLAAQRLTAADAVCILSHDAKFDVPAVVTALASGAGYVGAMGSRRTHDDRMRRLRAAGATDESLARLRSPLGLDLGGRGTADTALSILAEIVADRHGGSGIRLSERSGPVHARGEAAGIPLAAAPGEGAPGPSCAWDDSAVGG